MDTIASSIENALRPLVSPNGEAPALGPQFIRLCWVDNAGTLRGRIFPAAKLKDRTLTLVWCMFQLGCQDALSPGTSVWEELVLEVDWTSLYNLPYLTTPTASVFGYAVRKDPTVRPQEVPFCPRSTLRRAINYAKDKHGIEMLFGFELEFALLESISPVVFADGNPGGWSSLNQLRAGSKSLAFLEDLYDVLTAMGIDVPILHTESAPGQLEVPLGPLPPMQAVDQMVAAREAVHNVASKHGLKATFSPVVVPNAAGNGLHIHQSINRSADDKPADLSVPISGAMTRREQQYLAGLVKAMPSLAGITLPTVASYDRIADRAWNGGTWTCWGEDHRDVPVRLCYSQPAGYETRRYNFEVKQNDATANPYLAVAACIHAGLMGIEEQLELGPPAYCIVADMSAEERQRLGLGQRQPTSLKNALANFEADTKLIERIGKEAVDSHLAVRKMEAESYAAMSDEEKRTYIFTHY